MVAALKIGAFILPWFLWKAEDAAARRSPEAVLAEVQAIGEPDFDPARKGEPGYLENYKKAQHALYQRKAALLLELCRLHPTDSRVAEWMTRRWVLLGWNQSPIAVADEVLADIESILPSQTDPQIHRDGEYWRAYFRAHRSRGDAKAMLAAVERFVETYAEDERGAALLSLVADDSSADVELRLAIYRRLGRSYPNTHFGSFAPGMIRRVESVERPFILRFPDFLSEREVSTETLRGKIVVIDFWATTCPPCIAELPRLKELHSSYRDRGVEFIGVNLDESEQRGGLTALREFLRDHPIPWPQYYQGDGYESEFSKSWGVGSAPTLFIIDKRGLFRGAWEADKLEEMLQRLLREP